MWKNVTDTNQIIMSGSITRAHTRNTHTHSTAATQSLAGVHLMNTIHHTSVVKYTVGGTTRSMVQSMSPSDLHHQVSQVQHMNTEPFALCPTPPHHQDQSTTHLMFGKNVISDRKQSCTRIFPPSLIPSSFVFIHGNK